MVLFHSADSCKKIWNASQICVSSLCRGHANLLCIVPILVYVLPKQAHLCHFLKTLHNKIFLITKNPWQSLISNDAYILL